MTGESPTKTREEPPTANREVTPTTTKEESQPQIESWLYPETSLEPPATSRKENPSKTREVGTGTKPTPLKKIPTTVVQKEKKTTQNFYCQLYIRGKRKY